MRHIGDRGEAGSALGEVLQSHHVGAAVPVTVLLGPKGEVLFHEQGEIDLMEIRRAILANLPDEPSHVGSQKYWATK